MINGIAFIVSAALSVALCGWAARDAARRGRSWYGWSRLVFFTGIFGLVAWLVVRRRSPVTIERLDARRGTLLALTGVPLFVFSLLISTCIVTFLFQFARIEGQAMAPTLQDQERVFVNKLSYRLADPAPGDVVMLYYPVDPSKSFVKRIMAGPNDVIRSTEGHLYRNDVPVPDAFIPQQFRSGDTWGPTLIPPGYYFVMGDHRNNSSDSRSWGLVPKKYIVGRIRVPR